MNEELEKIDKALFEDTTERSNALLSIINDSSLSAEDKAKKAD